MIAVQDLNFSTRIIKENGWENKKSNYIEFCHKKKKKYLRKKII